MYQYLLSLFLFAGLFINIHQAAKLPNYITPCAKNDPNLNECALENGRKAIPNILSGDSTYGIPSLLPLKLDKLVLDEGQILSLNLENIEVHGLDKADLKDVKIDLNQNEVAITLAIPDVKIKSDYNVNGQLLSLPIQGHGPATFEFSDTEFTYKVKFNKINKDGAEYLQISDSSLQTGIKSAHIQLDNLFNGDKQLGDQMNTLLNENWQDIRQDIQPTVAKAIRSVIDKTFGKILDIVPLNEVFKS